MPTSVFARGWAPFIGRRRASVTVATAECRWLHHKTPPTAVAAGRKTSVNMKCNSISGPQAIILDRLARNHLDPGCQLSYVFRLRGAVNPVHLECALREVISHHYPGALDYFVRRGSGFVRRRTAMPESLLETTDDASALGSHHAPTAWSGRQQFRFTLARLAHDTYDLRLVFSHLIFDGACYDIFTGLLSRAYARIVGSAAPPVDSALSAAAESAPRVADESARAFWRSRLAGRSLGQQLTLLKPERSQHRRFISVRRELAGDEHRRLSAFVRDCGTTMFRAVVAACAVTLVRYGPDDYEDGLVIAQTVGTRRDPEALGCFMNVVPLFLPNHQDWSPRQYLAHVDSERRAVRAHQDLPTLELIGLADEAATRSRPLFNVVVNESAGLLPRDPPRLHGLQVELVSTPATGGPFDLGITLAASAEALRLAIDVPEELASSTLVSQFADRLLDTLAFFVEHPYAAVDQLDFGRPLQAVACGGVAHLPPDSSLIAQICAHAQATPDRIAVRHRGQQLDYSQLVGQAAELASRIAAAVPPAVLVRGVGLYLDRSPLLPTALLAALLLEVPFVPLIPSLPPDRLDAILLTTGLAIVVSDGSVDCTHLRSVHPTVAVVLAGPSVPGHTQASLPTPLGNDLAYLMFTSGSTGTPKGVAITRRNLVNFLCSMAQDPGFDATDEFLALTPISFDISILELLLPLYLGGTVAIVDDRTGRDAVELGRFINRSSLTVVQATPATWRMLKGARWACNRPLTVLCGGEALTTEIAQYLLAQGHALHNMYGPTETTIWSSCSQVLCAEDLTLGAPVLNTRYFVVDASGRSVPYGQAGELVIHGECVGAGYLHQDAASPFITLEGIGGRAYRTGDVVRCYGDGRIRFLGRRDNQRKVNGHRIELDEVSLRIRLLAGGVDVVTVVRESPTPHLCSFYWAPPECMIDERHVLDAARSALPAYMVPAALVRLPTLPLTPNGKIDTKYLSHCELPAPEPARPESAPAPAGSETLTSLRALVFDVLGLQVQDEIALGRLGLNSISYNLLSQAIGARYRVHLPPHRFYSLDNLVVIAREIDALRGDDTPATVSNEPAKCWSSRQSSDEPIAIIGYSVLMPQDLEADGLWEALLRRADLVSRRQREAFREPLHAAFLGDIEGFDARFFSISPLEANFMDPRQRLLLQTSWRALEDAGYAAHQLAGRQVGCYIAATGADYACLQARSNAPVNPYSLPGSSSSILANRISSFFNWAGPSATLDTACSGALAVLVRACRDLAAEACESALVGGVNLIADDQISRGLDAGNFMSPNYRCATFDADADGYVRGEGMGCFLLKRLSRAVADGDAIHGTILAYGENHGGRASSLTAPNPEAQAALLMQVYTPELARKVSYIETHGTGTRLGDPIEVDALKAAWKSLCGDTAGRTVWLGAIKSNIGHLEPAAGVASLAKVLLAMRHGVLPPNNHFRQLNPYISLDGSPFAVLNDARPWDETAERVAGISSFGFGGSNAHVVIGEAPLQTHAASSRDAYLLTLSARSERSLLDMQRQLRAFLMHALRRPEPPALESVAYTLNAGRTHFEYRMAWVAHSLEDFVEQLAKNSPVQRIAPGPAVVADIGDGPDRTERLQQLKDRYLAGGDVDWARLHKGESCRRMHLPTYRFDVRPFWFDRTRPDRTRLTQTSQEGTPA